VVIMGPTLALKMLVSMCGITVWRRLISWGVDNRGVTQPKSSTRCSRQSCDVMRRRTGCHVVQKLLALLLPVSHSPSTHLWSM